MEKLINLYAALMDEVKVRLSSIDTALSGRTGLALPIVREFCYLQLRFLCELIALSCLVAHGDIKSLQSHQTGKSYKANEILEMMAKLRPHFYPFSCKQTRRVNNDGTATFSLEAHDPQPLPREELGKLYGLTHRHLHRGSLRKLLAAPTPIDMSINLPEIVDWVRKINALLSVHTIAITDDLLITCVLRNIDNEERVQVAVVTRPVQSPPKT